MGSAAALVLPSGCWAANTKRAPESAARSDFLSTSRRFFAARAQTKELSSVPGQISLKRPPRKQFFHDLYPCGWEGMDQTYRVLVSRNSSRLHRGFAEFEF